MRETRISYIPALDGLRAVAVLLVLLEHLGVTRRLELGGLGVDIFFVLSGYLITSVLFVEWDASGDISLRAFYWRRVLRIQPGLFFLLAVYGALELSLDRDSSSHLYAIMVAALSVINWSWAFHWGPPGMISHAWSLGVEEQFYLLWPAAMIGALRIGGRRSAVWTLALLWGGAIAWRLHLAASGVTPVRFYAGTDTHADPLLAGCLLALVRVPPSWAVWVVRAWPLAVSGLVVTALSPRDAVVLSIGWSYAADGIFSAALIAAVVSGTASLPVWLSSPSLLWLGKRSYGFYLWHPFVIGILERTAHPPWAVMLIAAPPLSILAAEFSYRFVERPFLRLKDWQPGTAAAEFPQAGD